jgi:phage tail P2-like protein
MSFVLQQLQKNFENTGVDVVTYVTGNLLVCSDGAVLENCILQWAYLDPLEKAVPVSVEQPIRKWDSLQGDIPVFFQYLRVPKKATHFMLSYNRNSNAVVEIREKTDLLPPNATALEKSLALTSTRLSDLSSSIKPLWRIDQCPAACLSWFAWLFSVEDWHADAEDGFPVQIQRSMIEGSIKTHRFMGTIGGLKRALNGIGVHALIVEWWQEHSERSLDDPTFIVRLVLTKDLSQIYQGKIDAQLYNKIEGVVENCKPLSTSFKINLFAKMEGTMSVNVLVYVAQVLHLNCSG